MVLVLPFAAETCRGGDAVPDAVEGTEQGGIHGGWANLTDLAGYVGWNPLSTTAAGSAGVGERLDLTVQPPGFTLTPMPGSRTLFHQSETCMGLLLGRTRDGAVAMNEALAEQGPRP